MEDKYNKAVAIWISQRTGDKPEEIRDIEFNTIHDGYCETCEYTTMGITYRLRGHWRDVEMQYIPPAEFIREVSEIIQEREL